MSKGKEVIIVKDSKIKTFIHDDKTYFVFPLILLIAFIISCFFPSSVFADVKTSGRIWIAGDSIAADHSYEKEEDYGLLCRRQCCQNR